MTTILTFDLWFEQMLFGLRSPLGLEIFKVATFLGETITVIGIAGVVAVSLWSARAYRPYVAGLFVTLLGAAASTYFLKEFIARSRPGGLIPAVTETSYSFPSGHATAAMALYGFGIFLSWRLYPKYRKMIAVGGSLLILLIGFSRLYLGVHYPTDILAGFLAGGVWLGIGVWATKRLERCI